MTRRHVKRDGVRRDLCPDCARLTARSEDGSCLPCAIDATRAEERERQDRAERERRDRLGLHPFSRSQNLARLALDSALEQLAAAGRFAEGDVAAERLRVAWGLAKRAREAIR